MVIFVHSMFQGHLISIVSQTHPGQEYFQFARCLTVESLLVLKIQHTTTKTPSLDHLSSITAFQIISIIWGMMSGFVEIIINGMEQIYSATVSHPFIVKLHLLFHVFKNIFKSWLALINCFHQCLVCSSL